MSWGSLSILGAANHKYKQVVAEVVEPIKESF